MCENKVQYRIVALAGKCLLPIRQKAGVPRQVSSSHMSFLVGIVLPWAVQRTMAPNIAKSTLVLIRDTAILEIALVDEFLIPLF